MNNWSIYLLSNGTRTYVGSTTDVYRRLRQHNGEIVGGARSTKGKGPWTVVCYVSGFDGRSSACRWEKLVKSRARGLMNRIWAMVEVSQGKCPKGRNMEYKVPSGLSCYASADTHDMLVGGMYAQLGR